MLHTHETGCAVLEALDKGVIDKDLYDNYMKITKEQEYFQTTVSEKRKRDKEIAKLIKNYYKDIKKKNDF